MFCLVYVYVGDGQVVCDVCDGGDEGDQCFFCKYFGVDGVVVGG